MGVLVISYRHHEFCCFSHLKCAIRALNTFPRLCHLQRCLAPELCPPPHPHHPPSPALPSGPAVCPAVGSCNITSPLLHGGACVGLARPSTSRPAPLSRPPVLPAPGPGHRMSAFCLWICLSWMFLGQLRVTWCGPVEDERGLGAWPLALRHRWGPSRLPSGLREAPCLPQGSGVVPPGQADL